MAQVTDTDLDKLRAWFVANGGELHPAVRLQNGQSGLSAPGCHLSVVESCPSGVDLVKVPLRLTLSILNIPDVAPYWPKSLMTRFAPEAHVLSRLVIVEAYLQGEKGFWWPYLKAVPQPPTSRPQEYGTIDGDPFDTPFYWKKEEKKWLIGTGIHKSIQETEQKWHTEFEAALSHLESHPPPAEKLQEWQNVQPNCWKGYTWELYKWATNILSSRSFSSVTFNDWRPPSFRDTTLAAEIWGTSLSESLRSTKFSVIYPVLDIANHEFEPPVSIYNPGEYSIMGSTLPIEAGTELRINYNNNGNEKFLWAYGFTLQDNQYNRLSLSIDGANIQDDRHDEGLKMMRPFDTMEQVQDVLRTAIGLAQLVPLAKELANEREEATLLGQLFPTISFEDVLGLISKLEYRRLLYEVVDKIILGLQSYRSRVCGEMPDGPSDSKRWLMARQYREGNSMVLDSNIKLLLDFLEAKNSDMMMLSVSNILNERMIAHLRDPLRDLLDSATPVDPDPAEIWRNGLHEMTFTLWICLFWLYHAGEPSTQSAPAPWLNELEKTYGDPRTVAFEEGMDLIRNTANGEEILTMAKSYLDVVHYAADASSHKSLFAQPIWTERFLGWGLMVYRRESLRLESLRRIVHGLEGEEDEEMLYWGTRIE